MSEFEPQRDPYGSTACIARTNTNVTASRDSGPGKPATGGTSYTGSDGIADELLDKILFQISILNASASNDLSNIKNPSLLRYRVHFGVIVKNFFGTWFSISSFAQAILNYKTNQKFR